jgi:hypothetical protein
MRRLLIPLIAGCLLLGSAPAQARYGGGSDWEPVGVVDTWLVSGDHVVGRSQIGVSPTPTMKVFVPAGHTRVVAWRVENVYRAESIGMRGCDGRPKISVRYFTPKGEDVTDAVHTLRGYVARPIERGTFRTLYVHIHAKRSDASLPCDLQAVHGHHDRVILEVTS